MGSVKGGFSYQRGGSEILFIIFIFWQVHTTVISSKNNNYIFVFLYNQKIQVYIIFSNKNQKVFCQVGVAKRLRASEVRKRFAFDGDIKPPPPPSTRSSDSLMVPRFLFERRGGGGHIIYPL